MYQPKIKNTQKYDNHIVTPAKLILYNYTDKFSVINDDTRVGNILQHTETKELLFGLDNDNDGMSALTITNNGTYWNGNLNVMKSIIISETEEVEKGDMMYSLNDCRIVESADSSKSFDYKEKMDFGWRKILALPEHFSNNHLLAIANGKIKDGNKVLVKCESRNLQTNPMKNSNFQQFIHLDQQNHITLFPFKQSLKEFANEYIENLFSNARSIDTEDVYQAIIDTAEWVKENNH